MNLREQKQLEKTKQIGENKTIGELISICGLPAKVN